MVVMRGNKYLVYEFLGSTNSTAMVVGFFPCLCHSRRHRKAREAKKRSWVLAVLSKKMPIEGVCIRM